MVWFWKNGNINYKNVGFYVISNDAKKNKQVIKLFSKYKERYKFISSDLISDLVHACDFFFFPIGHTAIHLPHKLISLFKIFRESSRAFFRQAKASKNSSRST